MSFRNLSAWSIRTPVPSIGLFVALTLAGVVSFMRMDVNNQPDIAFPIVWVAISQPGAAPSAMETQITQRVKSAVRSLPGINEINSTATVGQPERVIQPDIGTIGRALLGDGACNYAHIPGIDVTLRQTTMTPRPHKTQ